MSEVMNPLLMVEGQDVNEDTLNPRVSITNHPAHSIPALAGSG